LQEWILERNLRSAAFDGCAVGVEADGKPARKPWRFVSSSSRLVENLAAQKCTHTAHEPLQGKWARMSAINSEKQGLLANGTWDESTIRPKAEVLAEARAKGQKIHVGALMVIVSIKGYEKSPAEWSIKARIVFRGDAVRDEDSQAAVFDELAASAPTSLGGLNLVIAFGLLDGHTCSTSDCIKAYVQSFLDSSCPTYVLLPAELVPDYARHMHQPVAPLIGSLYGHPLASARITFQIFCQLILVAMNWKNSQVASIFLL